MTQFETCDKARVSQCFIPIANNAFQVYLSPAQCADGSSVNSQEVGPRLQVRPCGGVTRAYQSLNAAEKKMGNAPVEVVGAGNVSPFSVSECVKDPQCFDAEYTCESCCQTGRSATLGLACWNSQFNAAACCRSPASGAASTVAALFSAVAPGTLVDSRGNAAAVDSRGYAAGSAGFDSRGRPVDQPDSSATAGIDAPASNVAAIASSVAGCAVLLAGIVAATVYRRRTSSKHSSSSTPNSSDSERRPSPRVVPVPKAGEWQANLSAELSTKAASIDSSDAEVGGRAAWPSP